jgi:two-component system, cell cycle response regulator
VAARILVIEDNKENLELMAYLLNAFGYQVLVAGDGQEGLEAARRELPDLILSDLQMPKLDGFEVARAVRQDPRLAKLPLVAVTAYAMRGDRDRVLEAGFDGYISKPIIPEEFVGQVERFLGPGQHATAAPWAAIEGHAQAPPPYRATVLAVDNSSVNLSLMRSMLEPFGYKVIPAGSALEGLKLARESPPDLILSDLHLPEMDGYEFLKAAKAEASLSPVPFVIISSTIWHETDLNVALRLGASKVLLRPIEPDRLVAEIEACLTERKTKMPGYNRPVRSGAL